MYEKYTGIHSDISDFQFENIVIGENKGENQSENEKINIKYDKFFNKNQEIVYQTFRDCVYNPLYNENHL